MIVKRERQRKGKGKSSSHHPSPAPSFASFAVQAVLSSYLIDTELTQCRSSVLSERANKRDRRELQVSASALKRTNHRRATNDDKGSRERRSLESNSRIPKSLPFENMSKMTTAVRADDLSIDTEEEEESGRREMSE